MGLSVFPPASGANLLSGWTAGVAGTFSIKTLPAGVYRISMDTTQSLNLSFSSNDSAYELFPAFSGTTRGGSGWVSLPYPMNRITIPSATFPFSIVLEKMDVTPPAPPTNPVITWNADKTQVTGTWDSIPSDATGVTFYWKIGSTTYSSPFSSTTSGATANIAAGSAPEANPSGIPFGLVCTNSSGAAGVIATGTTGAVPLATVAVPFTSSGTWISPITGTLTELLVVGGGGNGAGSGVPGAGGAGGAGGYRTTTTQAVTKGTTYVITVGGANTGSSFNGVFNASRGGGGNGGSGGSGGGGGSNGSSGGSGGAGNLGGYTPSEGNNGGGANSAGSGGGGGAGGAGGYGSYNGSPGPGVTNSITGTPVVYAQGGSGGASTGSPAGYGFGGGGGAYNAGQPGGTGYAGIVVIKYAY